MSFNRLPYHSLVISIQPILFLYSQNIVFTPFGSILNVLGISVLLSVIFLAGFRFILKDWQKAGLLCSLIFGMFFSFGHLVSQIEKQVQPLKTFSIKTSTLAWVWLILFICIGFFITRSKYFQKFTWHINLISLVLLVFPLYTIITSWGSINFAYSKGITDRLAEIRGDGASLSSVTTDTSNDPDIYYIILDGYERADKLQNYYGFDNSDFIMALRERGFYIGDESRSNYLNTTYSLNTSLNLIYFSDFPGSLQRNARYNLKTNFVNDFLRERGYQIVVFDSGTGDTNYQYYDQFITPYNGSDASTGMNAFEKLLLRTTVGVLLIKPEIESTHRETVNSAYVSAVNRELDLRRERISTALDLLPQFARSTGRYYVFAHLYSPHIPFLYGPDGAELKYSEKMNFYWYEPTPEDYIDQYGYQVEYLNREVLDTIDRIQSSSAKPYVIILQSDHGDDKYLDWKDPDLTGVNIRSSILNAVYFSDLDYQEFYVSITPVNTFRILFNHWFNASYPLLEDRVYFHEHPLEVKPVQTPKFLDACTNLGLCSGEQ